MRRICVVREEIKLGIRWRIRRIIKREYKKLGKDRNKKWKSRR